MRQRQKRILVTGGAGFLGSHLCEQLLERGYHVLCLDNLLTGNLRNIQHLITRADFDFIQHDVTVPLNIKIDEIYNLACPASPVQYQ
ncbi:MAG: GDP-mannose 4,6-dehydratase, partial [Chloroflexota bacterium]|nr:GDP-mannose 4,6-dehydratase [Chloroflexota bacterium]